MNAVRYICMRYYSDIGCESLWCHAGFVAAFSEGPIDFYKSQVQVQIIRSKQIADYKAPYTSMPDCVRATLRENGFRGPFQVSNNATCTHVTTIYLYQNVPYRTVNVFIYIIRMYRTMLFYSHTLWKCPSNPTLAIYNETDEYYSPVGSLCHHHAQHPRQCCVPRKFRNDEAGVLRDLWLCSQCNSWSHCTRGCRWGSWSYSQYSLYRRSKVWNPQ